MKKQESTKCKLAFLALLAIFAMGCKNQVVENKTPESVAKAYLENIFIYNNISNGRSAESNEYPDFLNDLEVHEDNGTIKFFSEYSAEEKAIMVQVWKDAQIKGYVEKFEADPELMEGIALENESFENAMKKTSRCAEEDKLDVFANSYAEYYTKKSNKIAKSRGADKKEPSDDFDKKDEEQNKEFNLRWVDNVDPNSKKKFIKNYKRGRILRDATSYPGHASMMYVANTDGNDKWDGMTYVTITSYPPHDAWPGQINGVQLEPLGYWCGNDKSLVGAEEVHLLKDVGQRSWFEGSIFKGNLKLPGSKIGESTTVNDRAIAKAEQLRQKGCPYVPAGSKAKDNALNYVAEFILYKDSEDFSYCSQLVWRGYKESGTEYDFSLVVRWVSPWDIEVAGKTETVTEWTNSKRNKNYSELKAKYGIAD